METEEQRELGETEMKNMCRGPQKKKRSHNLQRAKGRARVGGNRGD